MSCKFYTEAPQLCIINTYTNQCRLTGTSTIACADSDFSMARLQLESSKLLWIFQWADWTDAVSNESILLRTLYTILVHWAPFTWSSISLVIAANFRSRTIHSNWMIAATGDLLPTICYCPSRIWTHHNHFEAISSGVIYRRDIRLDTHRCDFHEKFIINLQQDFTLALKWKYSI